MPDPSDPSPEERLRALEDRIARAKGVEPARPHQEEHYSQVSLAWRMVIELVAGLMIGFGMGYAIDWIFGTLPISWWIFVFLGLAAGIKTMPPLGPGDAADARGPGPRARAAAGEPARRRGGLRSWKRKPTRPPKAA
jgi:ATP synthase protein I